MKSNFQTKLFIVLIALSVQACASTKPVKPKVIQITNVEKINIAASLQVRPEAETTVPVLTKGDTTRQQEDALLICAAEGKALKIQLNAILDSMEGHVGITEPEAPPEPEEPEEEPKPSFWKRLF